MEEVDRQIKLPAQEGAGGRQLATDIASGTLLHTDQIVMDPSERIRNFIWEKFNVEDIRELEIKPIDEESADEESEETPKTNKHRQTIDELYDIISVVGAGAFGIVIACRDRSSNKKFALKITSEDHIQAAASLRREKAMLNQMSHPNIIRVYEMRREYKNLVIMKMELGKESISSFLEKYQQKTGRAGLPEEQCAKIMRGLFRALAYLHEEQNVIHRDIKPDNIILGSHKDLSKVKLLDFGLAVQDSLDTITDFAKCGTFLYKPPEQVTNIFAYAKKADVWASGIIMFYLLTGRHPIWKEGMNKLQMEQVMKNFKQIQIPSSMSPQAQHLISCLCQKNQSARYRPVNALQHPWITRKLESELPLSDLDRRALAIKNQPIEDKLRKAMRVLLFCALSRRSGSGKHQHRQSSPGRHRQSNQLLGGGGESSTTQEETQHNSTGSLLNGQQLENYKQMIKAFDIEGGVNLSNSSKSHGNNPADEEDDIDDGDDDDDGNDSSCKSQRGHVMAKKKSFKHHVFSSGIVKNRGDLTPKSHQKTRDHNRTKRGTPKGAGHQQMSQMGESEFQNQVSEKEDDYFTSSKRLQEDGNRQLGIHSTTGKTRKQAGSLKKGKPPLNQKNSHTAVKGTGPQKLSSFVGVNNNVGNEKGTSQAVQGESFTGALDAIFTRQKATQKQQRAGSTQSNKSQTRKRNEDAESQESRRTVSEKSYSSIKKEAGGQVSDGARRLHFNSISKESSNLQAPCRKPVKIMSQSYSDKRLMTGGNGGSDQNKQSKTSFQTQSHRETDSASDEEQNRYIIDGQNSRNKDKRDNRKHDSCSNNYDGSFIVQPPPMKDQQYTNNKSANAAAKSSAYQKHPSGGKTDPLGNFTDKAEMLNKRRSKKNTQTQRGSQMEMRLSSSSKVEERNLDSSNERKASKQQQTVVGLGLLDESRQAQHQSQGGKGGFAALTEKYQIRGGAGGSKSNGGKAHQVEVANALKQREILSSAESTNHFITKTRVGGTLKNSRQVVAPVAPTKGGNLPGAHHHHHNQADIQDFLLNSQYPNPLFSASEEKGTPNEQVKANPNGGTALNNRKQSKMRREKFGQLKKQTQHKTQLLVENGVMQLPGINKAQSTSKQQAALYSAKHSVFEDGNNSLSVQRQHSLVHQTSFNYPGPSTNASDQINGLAGGHQQQKGLTPKRRQQIMTVGNQIKEGDSHKSSVSQLSPATALYHNDLAKSQPPRSTQVAGTAIIQGTKTAQAVAAAATVKQSASKNHRSKQQQGAAQLFQMPDTMLEGILTSSTAQNNSNVGDGLGVVGGPPASTLNPAANVYPGSSSLPTQHDIQKMIKQRQSEDGGSLNQSALLQHQTEVDFRASAGEADLNDRMVDSPKQRKYVPLLSKKLNKTGHGSSENVIATVGSGTTQGNGRAPSHHYEHRQTSTNGRHQMVNSPLDMSAIHQNRNTQQMHAPSSISITSATKQAESVRVQHQQHRFLNQVSSGQNQSTSANTSSVASAAHKRSSNATVNNKNNVHQQNQSASQQRQQVHSYIQQAAPRAQSGTNGGAAFSHHIQGLSRTNK